ncbi:MAG TPA: DUF4350 domain-containing protein [Thioploca sp.]|nr:MAG: hypothetical protein DRR19_30615 [Gammaproteobacteria bacterium]HDN26171.1 DUF4350 domain-containing protein [Thioploca sp.]
MKSSSIIIVLALLAAGIIIYIGFWFYNHFEIFTEEVEIGFQGEARDNPVLAAERLLQRMGISAKTVQSLPDVEYDLGTQDTLLSLEYGSSLDASQSEQLFSWVKEGGHLIMVSDTLYDVLGETIKTNADPLLAELYIRQYQNGLKESEIAEASPTSFAWAQYFLQVGFDPEYYLEPSYDPTKTIDDKYGTHLLFYYYGTGMISVLSDMAFIENDTIDEYDHAQFLWLLVNLERPAARVWLLRTQTEAGAGGEGNGKMPSLWILLWKNMWAVIISAMILLLFWLWARSRRFGTLLPAPPRTRRRLLEHIEASGHFLWQQDQALRLLHGARQALLKRLDSVHPDWTRLSHAELSRWLAQVCGLSADEIELALYGTKPDTEIAFTQTIQILTQIRKTL